MQQRIETHPDYATRIVDNPIVLLEEIQKMMHETVRAQYNMLTFVEAIEAFVTIKQKNDEDLVDYSKRFKQVRTTYKSYLGKTLFDHYVGTLPEYTAAADDAARNKIKSDTFEAFSALLILKGAGDEYKEVMKTLNMQKSMGIDQYPKTTIAAVDILVNHKTTIKQEKANNKARDKSKGPKQTCQEERETGGS